MDIEAKCFKLILEVWPLLEAVTKTYIQSKVTTTENFYPKSVLVLQVGGGSRAPGGGSGAQPVPAELCGGEPACALPQPLLCPSLCCVSWLLFLSEPSVIKPIMNTDNHSHGVWSAYPLSSTGHALTYMDNPREV